jgi:hypothetical protein
MPQDAEDKIVFALAPDTDAPLVLLGIPSGAWEHMKNGQTHTFDLTKLGLPLKLMLYGAADHTAAMKMIEAHLSDRDLTMLDLRRENFAIETPESK